MDWLNYHHLLYFWTVAREGSIARACERLLLAQPTVSGQLRRLEKAVGGALFRRVGRGLEMTDTGRTVYGYAEEIFSLGRELQDTLRDRPTGRALRLNVGVVDALPKLVVYRLLEPAMKLAEPTRIVCHDAPLDELLARLAVHEFDVVLSDSPANPSVKVRAFNHRLGECGVTIFAAAPLATRLRRRFPRSLADAPWLLPTENTALRRGLEQWFDALGIRPRIVGEFEDSALLKAFGQAGIGIFAAPTAIENEVRRQHRVGVVGRVDEPRSKFHAITVERRLKHPAVAAILQAARHNLFGE